VFGSPHTTEMIQFSATQELKATDEAIRKYMEANA
jgi:hypothetical protein